MTVEQAYKQGLVKVGGYMRWTGVLSKRLVEIISIEENLHGTSPSLDSVVIRSKIIAFESEKTGFKDVGGKLPKEVGDIETHSDNLWGTIEWQYVVEIACPKCETGIAMHPDYLCEQCRFGT